MSVPEEPADETQSTTAPLAPYWLHAIVESADDAIVSKTLDGIITSWNRSAERMFGYTADEVIGKPILILIPKELQSEETEILSKIRRGERVDHFETIRVAKDGRRLNISLTVSPIKTPDGSIIGASKIARDITEQKRAEQERKRLFEVAEEARHEAEQANLAKDQFLAVLSHELRTPLHSMLGWVNMLKSGMLKGNQANQALEVIIRGINSQNALIKDLLDVSRIVGDKLDIERARVSLVSIISDSVEILRPIAQANGIELNAEVDATADDIEGDSVRLQQVMTNVIGNAIKFTAEGGRIDVRLGRNERNAVVTVTDTGQGISPEALPIVFEKFRQGDSSSRREHSGLGLGLTIARHLAELHVGSLTAESPGEGKGSTFTLTLPLKGASKMTTNVIATGEQSAAATQRAARLSGSRLLIVEDDIDSLDMLRVVLQHEGADVATVDRSDRALEELKKQKFDVMISDLGMPFMDGYDLIREVRHTLGISPDELPAIAISGYVGADDRSRALENGFQVHLPKPLDISPLPDIIAKLVQKKED